LLCFLTASAGGRHEVSSVGYDLGDAAFTSPDVDGPIELTRGVHYPRDVTTGNHPLILILHGSWISCADSRPDPKRGVWPCEAGVDPLPSNRGYDYLATELASSGFVVVAINANGINAVDFPNGYQGRADLINKHLEMWQALSATGGGPLAGRFVDLGTGQPRPVEFTGHVDMTNVGTIGHSRGGKGVMWQAADKYRDRWPAGVQVKAVLALAPVYFNIDEHDPSDGLVTTVPFAVLAGTCDVVAGFSGSYLTDAKGRNVAGMYDFVVHGANHNYFNTQWSPQSGQVGAYDDFASEVARQKVAVPAGRCRVDRNGRVKGTDTDRQLSEAEQRRVALTYIPAFFRRHLTGDHRFDRILTGAEHPLDDVTAVDVTAVPPA